MNRAKFTGFRCYYRSTSGRLIPVRGGHYYDNGMYSTYEAAKHAAETQRDELNRQHPERRYEAYQV